MGTRSNACSELVRFWLQTRHGCLIDESVPVAVPYALSDIDLIALRPDLHPLQLPGGTMISPRLIVETKDEHDWDSSGREFGARLRVDVGLMADHPFIPKGAKGVKFSMLRQEHYEEARKRFKTDDFGRLFVVHALDPAVLVDLGSELAPQGIYWITIREVVKDLLAWYAAHPRPAALRQSLVGDLIHLLVGFCGLAAPAGKSDDIT